ncbi:glycosyltransferase family 2 protein [Bacteroidota bacterium]
MKVGLVSIAVPIFNVELYLEECLKSLLNQTYKNIEIILVNDGSTDSSLDICKRFLFDDRVILINKKNEGLSLARQVAIDKATGEYLCMIDSDDYLEKDFVEKLFAKIRNDACDIVLCASRFFSESYSKVHGFSNPLSKSRKILTSDIEKNFTSLLSYYHMSDSWAKIYNLNFL